MGTKRWWQRTTAAACATGLALGLALVGAGTASATTVNENDNVYNEPDYNPTINGQSATEVYSFTFNVVNHQPALTVSGGSMADGAVVNTWGRYNGFNYSWGTILSPNQLWEFIPEAANTGKNIGSGYGYLRNRQSGKCLELNLSDGKIDQWTCVPGAANELWYAPWNGGLRIKTNVLHSNNIYLGVNTPNGCKGYSLDGNGESLYLRDTPSECTDVGYKQDNYRFATNKLNINMDITGDYNSIDSAFYRCLPGYHFEFKYRNAGGMDTVSMQYENIGTAPTAETTQELPGPFYWALYGDSVHHMEYSDPSFQPYVSSVAYAINYDAAVKVGQLYLFCIPGTFNDYAALPAWTHWPLLGGGTSD